MSACPARLLYQTIHRRLMSDPGPAILKLRVSPNAARSEVVGWHGNALRVRVAAPPVNGRANVAVIRTLAAYLGIGVREIELVRGHGSRDKLVRVSGVDSRELIGLLGNPSGMRSADYD